MVIGSKCIASLTISGAIALLGDLLYSSKENAEQFMFGIFLNGLTLFMFTIFSILTLVYTVGYLLFSEFKTNRFLTGQSSANEYNYSDNCDCVRCRRTRALKSKSKQEEKQNGNTTKSDFRLERRNNR